MNQRKHRETALSALHNATQGFMEAKSLQAVAEHGVTTAKSVLQQPLNGIWLRNESGDELRLAAATDEGLEVIDEPPVYKPGESLSWDAYETGEVRVHENLDEVQGRTNPEGPIKSEIILPLGEYGVMNIGALEPQEFDEVDVSLAGVLADTITAALQRAEREQELENTIERLDQFASLVTHDLRTPLSVAAGNLTMYRESGGEAHLDKIEKSLRRIDELTEDLLVLTRSEMTDSKIELVALDDVARRAWEMIDTRSATLITKGGSVMADISLLTTLLENLFRNAVGHGGTDITVRTGPLQKGFFVEDTGQGIPPEDRSSVLEHGYSTGYEGSGVGLTIVRRIADTHDWTVTLTESDEGGARFEFHPASETF